MIFPLAFQDITNEPVVISTTIGQLITWIVIGLVAGMLASLFVRGRFSLGGMLFIGLVGAIVGGYLFFDLLGVTVSGSLANGIIIRWIDIVVAFVGALLILMLTNLLYVRRF